jgi:hypothetical protein
MSKRDEAHHAVKQAQRAAKRGDVRGAQSWYAVAEKAAAAARALGELEPVQENWEEVERRRAELRKRFMAFVEADQEIQRWEAEKELYDAEFFTAIANGTPPPAPLRDHPAGDPTNEENYLRSIVQDDS